MPVLITDGGDHTPEKWALATAQMLAPVDLNAPNARAALDLQAKLADILGPHHKRVQDGERASLQANGDDHLASDYTAPDHAEAAFEDVAAAFRAVDPGLKRPGDGKAWATFPDDPEWAAAVKALLASHFTTSQVNARFWHCDRPGASEAAIAWKAGHHGNQAPEGEPLVEPDEPGAAGQVEPAQ